MAIRNRCGGTHLEAFALTADPGPQGIGGFANARTKFPYTGNWRSNIGPLVWRQGRTIAR